MRALSVFRRLLSIVFSFLCLLISFSFSIPLIVFFASDGLTWNGKEKERERDIDKKKEKELMKHHSDVWVGQTTESSLSPTFEFNGNEDFISF